MTDEHFEQARKAAYKAAQYLSDSGENGGTEPQPSLPAMALGQLEIATDAESDAILSEREPGYDRFAESLLMIAGLPLSDADKAETIRLLLRVANR